ncbi:Clavaminate synthase-like protein, partial [Microstroma glucosiphilum]
LLPNKPCILPPDLISDWPAQHWAKTSSHTIGKSNTDTSSSSLHPAFDLLKQQYGDHIVPVVTTAGESRDSIAGTSQYESGPSEREEMTLSEAVGRLHEACRLREQATGEEQDTTPPAPLIYIKDWHLVRQEKLRHSREQIDNPVLPYTTPDLFLDDWMNNESFLPQQSSEEAAAAAVSAAIPDDFRFCYAGLRGTTTGLHRDVYTSYSWSTNLVGRKRWVLYSPQLSPLLRRLLEQGRGLAPLSAAERASLEEPESSTVVLQEEGETIFVPSDVFHTVENLEDTISLNHNWCNAVNLPRMYESIKEEMGEVQGALQDVREMLLEGEKQPPLPWQVEYWRLIQQVSRSDAGWDWLQFWQMVQRWLDPSSRACPSFVYPRVATMIQDFRQREEWQWLDAEVRTCVEDCSILIAPACR